jgi:catechol 2,3-dioxygenase-like lactoylglutathione lyase family enzyme
MSGPVQAIGQPASQQRLAVAGIDHVGINVPDVAVAAVFFSDLLGAPVVSDMRPGKIPDGWKKAFHWHKSSEIDRIVMMQLQDGSQIELFQYSRPDISRVRPHEDDAAETHIVREFRRTPEPDISKRP